MAGRPHKLTPEVQKRICEAIRNGNYFQAAAAYAGVTYRSLRSWLKQGQKAKAGRFFQFFQAVKAAEAEAEVRIVAQWQQQIPENWQAARDFLARRYPDRWMPKERHEVTGKGGGPVRQVEELIVVEPPHHNPEANGTPRTTTLPPL